MKKDIITPYEIKLEFNFNTENPSRLFQSFADIIDSIIKLDTVFAKTVNTSVSSKMFLNDIEKGSLIAKLWNELIINDEESIDREIDKDSVKEYIEESRIKTLEFVSKGSSTIGQLETLSDDIFQIATDKKLDKTLNFAQANILDLAKSINNIHDSVEKLNENEKFSLKTESSEVSGIISGQIKIDIDEIENLLTKEEIINESTEFYKIKKPDFLGDSQWEFKRGSKTIKVKILHEEWLLKFHDGIEVVLPGDSLKVKVKSTSKYNKNGYLISDKIEIVEVIEIKRN